MSATARTDILDLLVADHEAVKKQFASLDKAAPEERQPLFCELVQDLVRHEVAEEVVLYPTIRLDAPHGDAEAAPRLEEQAAAEEQLAALEKTDPASEEFARGLAKLERAVLRHAEAEEREIFPLLRAVEDDKERIALGDRYDQAKASAPTHPHPHAPDTPPGNLLVGPVAAMFDKARDAARGALGAR